MLVSKPLSLVILRWPMFTFGAVSIHDVFQIASSEEQGGACNALEMDTLNTMFPEMQSVAVQAFAQNFDPNLREHYIKKQQPASSFGTAKGGAPSHDFSEFIYEPVKRMLGTMSYILASGNERAKEDVPLLWCNSLAMIWRKGTDSTVGLKGIKTPGQTIAQLLAQTTRTNEDGFDQNWWIFTATTISSGREATLFFVISKTEIPGIEVNGVQQPFPNTTDAGPTPCNHPTTNSWSFQGIEIVEGQLQFRKILVLCPLFWPEEGEIGYLLKERNYYTGVTLDEIQPAWFDFYLSIFQLLFPRQILATVPVLRPKMPQIGSDPGAGLTYKHKIDWYLASRSRAHDSAQCLALSLFDQAAPVQDFYRLAVPKSAACLTWYSIANWLEHWSGYTTDWSLGYGSDAADHNALKEAEQVPGHANQA